MIKHAGIIYLVNGKPDILAGNREEGIDLSLRREMHFFKNGIVELKDFIGKKIDIILRINENALNIGAGTGVDFAEGKGLAISSRPAQYQDNGRYKTNEL
jgi:hypothetical protein